MDDGRVFNNYKTGTAIGAGTAYHYGAHEFTPVFIGFVLLNIKFSVYCFVDHCSSCCLCSEGQTMICKTQHRKLKIERKKTFLKTGINAGARKGKQLLPH